MSVWLRRRQEGLPFPRDVCVACVCTCARMCPPGLEQTGQKALPRVEFALLPPISLQEATLQATISTALSLSYRVTDTPTGLGQGENPSAGGWKRGSSLPPPLLCPGPTCTRHRFPIKTHMWRQWALMAREGQLWELMQTVQGELARRRTTKAK